MPSAILRRSRAAPDRPVQFALTSEQQLVMDSARRLFGGFASSRRAAIASPDGFDRAEWRRIVGEMGFGALALDEVRGGAGLGLIELALVMIEAGHALHASPFLPSIGVALPLLQAARDRRWVADVARGDLIAAPVLIDTIASGANDRLRGAALVPFGHAADLFVVVAGDALVVLPALRDGVDVRRHASMDLTRPLATVTLDLAITDEDRRPLPEAARTEALDFARVALAAECVGAADAALAMTTDYAKQRIQFDRPIGSFQAIKHRLADMMIEVEAAKTAVYYAAAAADERDAEAATAAAIAHTTAIEALQLCAGNAIQLHGGIGFTWEHDAHLFLRRARSAATLLGTPAASRERLAQLIGLGAAAA